MIRTHNLSVESRTLKQLGQHCSISLRDYGIFYFETVSLYYERESSDLSLTDKSNSRNNGIARYFITIQWLRRTGTVVLRYYFIDRMILLEPK